MDEQTFQALVVTETENGNFERAVRDRLIGDLPNGDVLIRVHYSSLNYKDALSATGNKGVTREYPHTPGIDASGIVEDSSSGQFKAGQEVLVTGYDLGSNTDGGFAEYIRVPESWVVSLPDDLSLRESMILGTAGFTAGYGIYKLLHNDTEPGDGEVLVTGATGGVASLGIAILNKIGYRVAAATGKSEQKKYLEDLGAEKIIGRDEVQDDSGKPLLSGRWAGVLDTVGGIMLDTAIRQTRHNGTVACCGNILGHELHTSIYPFILRGVSLMGIDSAHCPMSLRKEIWSLLATDWKPEILDRLADECSLEELEAEIKKILRGDQTGRILVNLK